MKPKAVKRDDIDLILASTAIMEGAVLVSNDSLFGKLQNLNSSLQYENWTIDDFGSDKAHSGMRGQHKRGRLG